MKVLIVGGAGYIGGALTDILLKTKHELRVYDALLYEESYLKDVPFVFGDIREKKKLKKELAWADAVVWLAALVGDGACALNPEISTELNQDMVKWLAKNFDGRIIFMSTCSVYGEHDNVLDETAPTNPLSVYAQTKLAAEEYLKNKNAIIFRLGTIFGLGDSFARIRLDLVLNTLTTRAIIDGKFKVFGGEQWRPLLHVRDAAQAVADNIETSHTGIYNLHNENVKIIDLARDVEKHVPDLEMEIVDIKFQDARNYKVNSDKARKTFGFKPKFSADQGIEEVKKLIEDGRIKDVNNPRYSNQGFLTLFNSHKLPVLEPVSEQTSIEEDKPLLVEGGLAVDDRGQVSFANGFDFSGVKRYYMVSNHAQGFVRAWHAHKKEAKYVMVVKGSAVVAAVKIDDWDNPSKYVEVKRYVLSEKKPAVLYIPAGHANGFMSLTEDAQLMFFSTSTLEESLGDDIRFHARHWDVWPVEER